MIRSVITLALLVCIISTAHAETIYKSVDQDGNVSYSSTPPEHIKDTTEVDIMPPPSDDQIRAAQQQHEQRVKTGEILEENRQKRNEITAEENRLKREKQQQDSQTEKTTNDQYYGYPYIPGRNPGRPVIVPPIHRPILP